MKKKKVLFVATVVKTHMMQFHLPYLKMFQDMGWETAVASRNDYEDPADCVIPFCDTYYDIPFERMPWKPKNLTAYRMLKKIIDEGEYDIIHCHTPVGAMIARLAALSARKKGTKVIYTAHGFHFFKGAPLLNWLVFFPAEWLLAPVTDVLITINLEDHARAKRLMKASLRDLREEAFSTRSRIFDTVDWPNSLLTSTRSRPVRLTQPERTQSPAATSRGRDSPVRAAVSSAEAPSLTTPSSGIFSPGRTTMISPTATSSGSTGAISPSRSTWA